MNIVEMKIESIIPYEKNPRKNDDAVKYVANSIKSFGFKVPIIIDSNNVIVAGHTRYKAAKQLGLDVVPCIIADDLSDKQIKAFRLADNKVAEKAEWDFGLLDEELEPITKLGDIWQLGNHRLMCGDSTDKSSVEKLMDNKKADLVFTDPPYGVDYEGINNDSRNGLYELLDKAFCLYKEFSKPGTSIYCFHSDKCADIFHDVFRKYCHFSSMII